MFSHFALRTLKFGSILFADFVMLLAIGWVIAVTLILPKGIYHFHQLIITTYTDGTMDFSTDATLLIRGLGIVSLLTMILGLTIGAAMGLTASSFGARVERKVKDYETALTEADFMKITTTPDGTTYQLTEHGRQFLRDYAFLDRESITLYKPKAKARL